eukprot:1160731-Pelagomonas_calceolata.AAC.1
MRCVSMPKGSFNSKLVSVQTEASNVCRAANLMAEGLDPIVTFTPEVELLWLRLENSSIKFAVMPSFVVVVDCCRSPV